MSNKNFLIFTNLFPYFNDTQGGSFITNRLMIFKSLNIDFNVYAIIPDDTYFVKLLKKYSGKKIFDNTKNNFELNGINYNYIKIHRNLLNVIKERTIREKIFLQYSNHILKILYDQIKNQNYNLIIAHGMYDPPAGLIAKIFSEKLNIPYIVNCQGSDINYKMQLSPELYIDVFENAAKVVFVSNAILDKAKDYGYSGNNAIVSPNGVDLDNFKLLDKNKIKIELGLKNKVVGFVGNLLPVKRADKLPEIFYEINKQKEVDFLVVGDGPLKKEIEQRCKEKNLNVLFTGKIPHDEIPKYMNAMDVMILPSRNEGFGAVVIEAQSCGVPVVGSDNGGIPEAVGNGGIIVKEGDYFEKRFATAVIELLDNPIDSETLRQRSLSFSWQNIVNKELEIYEKLIK
ncbi:MAG TPA: glycosyltransferase [Bacteroidales bacterium]|jgi:glycosyltransferase involved in cell wall biosynthesis|nr:glycosyltransferase [Bacteroidales bacterium]HQC60192.1 glycosyltransferase [Bacteroidales bacterium]HQH59616.1 glycosyltransferase [Bacteroidales bacterium]